MNESIEAIIEVIEWYKDPNLMNPHELVRNIQVVSAHFASLETLIPEAKMNYLERKMELIQEGYPVNKSETIADIECPEYYKLRHCMNGAKEMLGAMRSQLSFLKLEYNND